MEQLVRDIGVMSEKLGVENGAVVCAEPNSYRCSSIDALCRDSHSRLLIERKE